MVDSTGASIKLWPSCRQALWFMVWTRPPAAQQGNRLEADPASPNLPLVSLPEAVAFPDEEDEDKEENVEQGEEEEVEDDEGMEPDAVYCSQGHACIWAAPVPEQVVKKRRGPRQIIWRKVTCDRCGKEVTTNTWRCATCDWDICFQCAA
eukprot:Skav208060  [mRNA]  locus=scaffold1778:20557:21984:+ [translate_table: standard]